MSLPFLKNIFELFFDSYATHSCGVEVACALFSYYELFCLKGVWETMVSPAVNGESLVGFLGKELFRTYV